MPLPILIPAAAIAANVLIAKKIHDKGKKEGRDEAKEEYAATVNDLKKKLQEMQKEREKTKNGFQKVIKNIGKIDINDTNFFSKVASLINNYTNFHVYVITCISYCRYQILKLKIPKSDTNDLKTIGLGLVQAGFTDKLKEEIDIVWKTTNQNQIMTTYHKYKGKLDKNLQLSIGNTEVKINEYLQGYAVLSSKVKEFEKEIAVVS